MALFADPIKMKKLIGTEVTLTTIENKTHKGFVHAIDPVFETVVLHIRKVLKGELVMFPRHAITDVKSESPLTNENNSVEMDKSSTVNANGKKELLKKWLEQQHLTVTESGENLKIDDHLTIIPPYEVENCICNNTIILEKIQRIILQMPIDDK